MSNIFDTTTRYCIKRRNDVFKEYVQNSRGWNQKTIDQWELGYFPPRDLLSLKVMARGDGFTTEDLVDTHIMMQKDGKNDWSVFFNRIIFPISDVRGKKISITGRVLDEKTKPKYFNTEFAKVKNLYGLNFAVSEIRKKDRVYVFEGNADVISSHQYGVKNTVCVMGTAMTDDHLILLSKYTSNVVILFDNDKGGLGALSSFNEKKLDEKRAATKIYRCSLANYKDGSIKDVDEFMRASGPDEFEAYVEQKMKDDFYQTRMRNFKKTRVVK